MIDTSKLTTEELVKIYQNTEDEAVLEEIITRNMGLYHVWAMEWDGLRQFTIDADDLVSEAMIETWRAISGFDCSKGFKFTTYLKKCVDQRFIRIYDHCNRKKRGSGIIMLGGGMM